MYHGIKTCLRSNNFSWTRLEQWLFIDYSYILETFEFLGCDEHRYSYGCALQCPDKCKDNNCDVINGSCTFGCTDPDALTPDCIGKYIFSTLICKFCKCNMYLAKRYTTLRRKKTVWYRRVQQCHRRQHQMSFWSESVAITFANTSIFIICIVSNVYTYYNINSHF